MDEERTFEEEIYLRMKVIDTWLELVVRLLGGDKTADEIVKVLRKNGLRSKKPEEIG